MKRPQDRRGATLILTAITIVIVVGMAAFAIDIGYIAVIRTEMQSAVDSGALAGASVAILDTVAAEAEAEKYVTLNIDDGSQLPPGSITINFGRWDTTTRTFVPVVEQRNAVEVILRREGQPFFFGRVFNGGDFSTEVRAVASFQPRDIMLVLDYSGSMSNDSQLRSVDALGQAAIEANLLEIYRELGSPTFGSMGWNPGYHSSNDTTTILRDLGLTNEPYPYTGGSWADYIEYIKNDRWISRAGYAKHYGYLTWVNYLQAERYSYNENPDLWKTSQQPVTAVKDAVDVLTSYLQTHAPGDQVGLSLYTAADGTAVLESQLTSDMQPISQIARQRQAGHYMPYTNIADGMRTGRLELENNGRSGAHHMMVLMTDGQANRPGSATQAKQAALDEARAAADKGIPVVTISLGAGADTNLMQQIADITGGVYFEVPGGQPVAQYEEQLKDVFREVAGDRKIMLVQ